jgi:acetoin utilization deacetylase AcuC-like enzyme
MPTAYISHPDCHGHDTGVGHPERAARLSAIEDRLLAGRLFDFLRQFDAPEVSDEQLRRVHTPEYIERIEALMPSSGHAYLDPDTVVSPGSLKAARRAAGAVVLAVDLLMRDEADRAVCAVRPPGHHAERARAMGFCIFNNIAVGAAHALQAHGLGRVAILDFDVHQGNGTEQIFRDEARVMFCSCFQHPFYPNSPLLKNTDRMISIPLQATARGAEFRAAVTDHWLPALEQFVPEMVFVSAGFDAHRDDDMSGVALADADYRWVTEQIVAVADRHASGRIVSVLEGGYELDSLARCMETHIRVLMGVH